MLIGQLNKLTKKQLVDRTLQLQKELNAKRSAPMLRELYGGDTSGGYAAVGDAVNKWNEFVGDTRQVSGNDTGIWVLGKLARAVSKLIDEVDELNKECERTSKQYQQAWDFQREAEDRNATYERAIANLVVQLHEQAERLHRYQKVNAKEDRNV